MNFKPGDKVWVRNVADGDVPVGVWAATIIGPSSAQFPEGWYQIDVEGWSPAGPFSCYNASGLYITPRFDPPPQQEPKQLREPTWDDIERLVQWRPAVTEVV